MHPPEAKEQTAGLAIEVMPVPDELELVLGQHIGAPCTPTVARRDQVQEGGLIGEVKKGLGVPLHSPVAGTIKALGNSGHPMRVSTPSVTITVDHDVPAKEYIPQDWQQLEVSELLSMVHDAGIVGIGGAGFPSHVKLSPPSSTPIDTLVLNGAECEPYITADHRQMLEHARDVVEGARIICKILGVSRCSVGIESNKPDAIQVMEQEVQAVADSQLTIEVCALQVKYPQGSEKQLIQAITGRKVPAMSLPSAVGVVVHNVSTARAIYQAVALQKPLYEKVITVAGKCIERPANLQVKLGTKISDIVNYLGGLKPGLTRIIMGGPMMGFAVSDLDIPITKTTSALLFLAEDEVDTNEPGPCIRCGWCLDACPMGLEPKEIGVFVEAGRAEDTAQFGVFDCFECGSCAFVCPMKRPLVQFVRLAKMKIKR
ncbi:electron transport complex subunit RsxC [Desulfotalea psychrophila]|uniref:electron transport complex subunit RsxC n=1 Tax=Desulfotalea psychrophila TaxID=84980 RepID=UPI0018E0866F|nr:electron transport complex subunit RsxC [Desulfotalea psychrophila]